MKGLVVLAFVLLTTVVYAEVQRVPRLGPCVDLEGNEHPLEEEFKNVHDTYCEKCTCYEMENVCISKTNLPVKVHPTCESIFQKETCDYRVVKRDDPEADCPFPYKIPGEN